MIRALILLATVLAGCAAPMKVTMMPRGSGEIYTGQFSGTSNGQGTIAVQIGDLSCSGPAARVASTETTSTAYIPSMTPGVAGLMALRHADGDSTVKAILSCSDGTGMRCDLVGRDRSGGGTCANDAGRIFDVIVTDK